MKFIKYDYVDGQYKPMHSVTDCFGYESLEVQFKSRDEGDHGHGMTRITSAPNGINSCKPSCCLCFVALCAWSSLTLGIVFVIKCDI